MQVSPYLSFKGQCEAAFKFYERCLGGQIGEIFRYGGSPMADQAPADWQDKVMHGSVKIGDLLLMGGDVAPDRYEEPKGIVLSLQIETADEAQRVFRELAQGGNTVMPFEKTFWSAGFGMLVDRFGIPWQVNCNAPPTEA
jgi:PhnB protein